MKRNRTQIHKQTQHQAKRNKNNTKIFWSREYRISGLRGWIDSIWFRGNRGRSFFLHSILHRYLFLSFFLSLVRSLAFSFACAFAATIKKRYVNYFVSYAFVVVLPFDLFMQYIWRNTLRAHTYRNVSFIFHCVLAFVWLLIIHSLFHLSRYTVCTLTSQLFHREKKKQQA